MSRPARQPSLYISHGGGPCFWMDWPPPFGPGAFEGLRTYLAGILAALPERPRAILVVSAHWEAAAPTFADAAAPGMVFDYYGFPPHTYRLSYPAPGAPDLARRAAELLRTAGIASATDSARGFDHGIFVPFLILDPEARVPVLPLSLRRDLDPRFHLDLGRALAPLRDEGVLIVGSGNSFHNLSTFADGEAAAATAFDDWLTAAVTDPAPAARDAALENWSAAPFARACHPREEHLLPLMVAAGAAPEARGSRAFHEIIGGKPISGYAFGG